MKKFIKKLVLLGGILLTFESNASAVPLPCSYDTLAGYIALGSTGCTIDNFLFSNFAALDVPASATPIAPGDINLNPLNLSSNPGIEFLVNLSAGPGELLEALIGYNVSGTFFTGNTLSMDGSSVTGDGAVTVVEDKCLGGSFIGALNCFGTPATLILFDIGIEADTFEEFPFPPVNFIDVITDIAVDGGINGFGELTSAANQFQTASRPIPEPSTLLLIVSGLCGIGFIRAFVSRVIKSKQ